MKIAGTILAAIAAFGIAGTAALAQQMRTGMVTGIDRISSTISIRDMPDASPGQTRLPRPKNSRCRTAPG